jgi:hypothetical protein
MNILNPKRWGAAFGAGLLATVALLPQAKGELVYEEGATAASAQAQVEDRLVMRQAIGSSQKAQATLQAQQQEPVAPLPTAAVEAPASSMMVAQPSVDVQNLSKSELMRRERQREELKNEDILQERLEELRLRDERRRTDEVLGVRSSAGSESVTPAPAMAAAPMREEIVMAPVTEGGTPGLAPAMSPAVANTGYVGGAVPASSETTMMSQSTMSVAPGFEGTQGGERTRFSVTPRAGVANMMVDGGYFEVAPRFGAGVAAGISASDHFTFLIGYTFNQYGVSMASNSSYFTMGAPSTLQTLTMNENVFDAGVRVYLLGVDSVIRPFVGGGGSYARKYINFSSTILNQMNATYGTQVSPDYVVNNIQGFLSAGLDFKVARNIAVGADFRYYASVSESQSGYNNAYNNVFYGGYYGGYPPGAMGVNPTEPAAAGSGLALAHSYSLMGNVTFSF